MLGGPFLPHIEHILRRKAASVDSPVVSASDAGNRWSIKSVGMFDGRPYQSCDIAIEVKKDLELVRLCLVENLLFIHIMHPICILVL